MSDNAVSRAGAPDAAFTLAVDAMGGDRAPEMVVRGVAIAAERHPGA
ncbi:MAG: phosphate acyltransferase, partial [Acetobacteraceae bacterium]|nr:phosphate acyltransferase [Acetobacteraceae bacterium]